MPVLRQQSRVGETTDEGASVKYNPRTWVTRALNQRVDELERQNKLLHRRLERQADVASELRRRNQVMRVSLYQERERTKLWKHRATMIPDSAGAKADVDTPPRGAGRTDLLSRVE